VSRMSITVAAGLGVKGSSVILASLLSIPAPEQ
jgi:hypothetical protein